MRADAAESLALQALSWMAQQPDALGRLMAASGLGPADLRGRIGDPQLLAGVLDFLLADEALLVAFCADAGLKPEAPARARRLLPGFAHE